MTNRTLTIAVRTCWRYWANAKAIIRRKAVGNFLHYPVILWFNFYLFSVLLAVGLVAERLARFRMRAPEDYQVAMFFSPLRCEDRSVSQRWWDLRAKLVLWMGRLCKNEVKSEWFSLQLCTCLQIKEFENQNVKDADKHIADILSKSNIAPNRMYYNLYTNKNKHLYILFFKKMLFERIETYM